MSWQFADRAAQIDAIRAALRAPAPGPVVITGDHGVGRTSVLAHALADVDHETHAVLRIVPAGDTPFAALRPHLPADCPPLATRRDAQDLVVSALLGHAPGRRLVVVVDDAHLVDHASILALRALVRRGGAALIVSRPTVVDGPESRPDPTDCLRYEPGVRTLTVPSLTVGEVAGIVAALVGGRVRTATAEALHAATGGNPRRLRELLVTDGLVDTMESRDGQWRLGETSTRATAPDDALVAVTRGAWRELAFDRAEELCRLAAWHGVGAEVAEIRASLLLLRGRVAAAVDFVDSLPAGAVQRTPQLALVKAMGLAFGGPDTDSAADYLLAVAAGGAVPDRVLAYRAWLLVMTGRPSLGPDLVGSGDREARLFAHAATATALLRADRAKEAVFHLRQASAIAAACQDAVPWMRPYLRARLIDALLFAGRISEATAVASDFHAGERTSGWDVVVAIGRLTSDHGTARTPR